MSTSFEDVTNAIVTLIETSGTIPWSRPWNVGSGPISVEGRAYSGVNTWVLGLTAEARGWRPIWGTYKAISRHGGQVRKGEKGTIAVFWKFSEYEDKETGTKKTVPMLRAYKVFSIDQAEWPNGCDCPGTRKAAARLVDVAPDVDDATDGLLAALEAWRAVGGPSLSHGGDRAFYRPSEDKVQMPRQEAFHTAPDYATTLAHEYVHSTGHGDRLARKGITDIKPFGTPDYSREELVAEMGAAMLAGLFSVPLDLRKPAGYVQGWLSALKEDVRAVVVAAGAAEKAVRLIVGDVEVEDVGEVDKAA